MPLNPHKPIEIVEYHPAWKVTFGKLRCIMRSTLGDLASSVEHIGSTAIPGLPAKPIIDLDVVIESKDVLPQVIAKLLALGYHHQGNKGIFGREAFARQDAYVPYIGRRRIWQDHHLYVCTQDCPALYEHLRFRDYLLAYPETARHYADLKRNLATQFRYDRPAYVAGKTEFITGILRIAYSG